MYFACRRIHPLKVHLVALCAYVINSNTIIILTVGCTFKPSPTTGRTNVELFESLPRIILSVTTAVSCQPNMVSKIKAFDQSSNLSKVILPRGFRSMVGSES